MSRLRDRKTVEETSTALRNGQWMACLFLHLEPRLKCAGMVKRFCSSQDLVIKQLLKFSGYISKEQDVNLSSLV